MCSRAPAPSQLCSGAWVDADSEYRPVESLLNDAQGKPVSEVRVCREEAEVTDEGHVLVSGRGRAQAQTGSPKQGA